MPSGWRRKTAATSSLCANATFARKIGSRKFSLSAATIRGWCASYRPWSPARPTSRGTTNRPARRTCVRMRASAFTTTSISSTKILGLGYVRVPTWLPCRLQIYFNGHSWLASRLRQRDIDFRLIDNAFVDFADWQRAQHIANELEIKRLHRRLDEMAHRFCPIYRDFGVAYHWSVDQCEYATDIVFPQAGGSRGHLRQPDPDGDPHRQARQHRHVPRPQAQRRIPRRTRQPLQHPHRRHPHQTHHGPSIAEALRQVRSHSADRDDGQRSDIFQALPRGRTP